MGWGQTAQYGTLLVLPAALLSACSTVSPAEPASAAETHILQKNFTVGELKSASVGETMLSLKDYYEKDRRTVWSIGQPVTLRVGLGSMVLIPGDYTALRKVDEDGTAYDAVEIKVHPFELTTLKPSKAITPMMFFIGDTGRIARAGGGLGISMVVSDLDPADFRASRGKRTDVDAKRRYTNFELLYAGMAPGAVHLTYREYAPTDTAHPSQVQDLTYNLSDKSIRFKDILIDIESADNQSIRFRVKSVPQTWTSAQQ